MIVVLKMAASWEMPKKDGTALRQSAVVGKGSGDET